MNWLSALRARYSVIVDPQRTERRVELVLVGLLLLLLLQLILTGLRLGLADLPTAKAPSRGALAVNAPVEDIPLPPGAIEAINARPLFWQGRRPIVAAPEPTPEEKVLARTGKIKDISLMGVFGADDSAGIIARVKDKQRRILIGESVNG